MEDLKLVKIDVRSKMVGGFEIDYVWCRHEEFELKTLMIFDMDKGSCGRLLLFSEARVIDRSLTRG